MTKYLEWACNTIDYLGIILLYISLHPFYLHHTKCLTRVSILNLLTPTPISLLSPNQ
jgi:hypothetical protein